MLKDKSPDIFRYKDLPRWVKMNIYLCYLIVMQYCVYGSPEKVHLVTP